MSMAVDTLKLAKSLADAGMERTQAEAVSTGIAQSLRESDVATKSDIQLLRSDMERLRADMKTEAVASRNQTILAMIAIAGLALAIARFLP
jgi:hypothetical protein